MDSGKRATVCPIAHVDLTIVPNPEPWLTERLGSLANFTTLT